MGKHQKYLFKEASRKHFLLSFYFLSGFEQLNKFFIFLQYFYGNWILFNSNMSGEHLFLVWGPFYISGGCWIQIKRPPACCGNLHPATMYKPPLIQSGWGSTKGGPLWFGDFVFYGCNVPVCRLERTGWSGIGVNLSNNMQSLARRLPASG